MAAAWSKREAMQPTRYHDKAFACEAVKILPGELSLGVDAAAFERELMLLAGRLGHPGLVRPQGAGRAE